MAQRNSCRLARSRIGSLSGSLALACLPGARPDHCAVPAPLGPHAPAADVMTLPGLGALETKEPPAVPVGARHGLGDGRERGVALALPGKAILQHHHLVGILLPCSDQFGAGLDTRFERRGIEGAVTGSGCDLAQPLLCRLRQSAECLHLHLVGDGLHEQLMPEVFWRWTAVEVEPALAQLNDAEIGQARDLDLNRRALRRSRHDDQAWREAVFF